MKKKKEQAPEFSIETFLSGKENMHTQLYVEDCLDEDKNLLQYYYDSKTGDILKEHLFGNYVQVRFMENGERKAINIHRLVALTFVPNPKNFPIVNHKDENKLNNRADNLIWVENNVSKVN